MYIEYTVYVKPQTGNHTVGFYIYNNRTEKRQLGGDPSMPIREFKKIIEGTNQYNDFCNECAELEIPIR